MKIRKMYQAVIAYLTIQTPLFAQQSSIGEDARSLAQDEMIPILTGISILFLVVGATFWATGNERGKEMGKGAVAAAAVGMLAPTIVDTIKSYLG